MVTDDVHTAFAEHTESIIALIVNSVYQGIPGGDCKNNSRLHQSGMDIFHPPLPAQSCIYVSSKVHSLSRGEHLPP